MKFRKLAAFPPAAVILLTACVSTQSPMPPSDYKGVIPDELSAELQELNDTPARNSQSRGSTEEYHFNAEQSLLTFIVKLRSQRWYWSINLSDVEAEGIAYACDEFADLIEQGLGVRYWYAGNDGFVTPVISQETCLN